MPTAEQQTGGERAAGPGTPPARPPSWARDHLANERTLLAWLRTALAFMAFGVALAKMAVLVRVVALDHPEIAASIPDSRTSAAFGAALVFIGGTAAVLGAIRTRRWSLAIDPSGSTSPPTRMLHAVAALTVASSIALTLYVLL